MNLQTDFFDIWSLFQNEVVGSITLFTIIGLIIVLIVCLKNNMGFAATVGLIALWIMVIYAGTLSITYSIIAVFAIGVSFYLNYTKAIKRS